MVFRHCQQCRGVISEGERADKVSPAIIPSHCLESIFRQCRGRRSPGSLAVFRRWGNGARSLERPRELKFVRQTSGKETAVQRERGRERERESTRTSSLKIWRVSLESSAEYWPVYTCEKTIQGWRKDNLKRLEGKIPGNHIAIVCVSTS